MDPNIVHSVTIKTEPDIEEKNISLVDFPFICRICLGRGELRLFEEEQCSWDLFLNLTKIEVHSTIDFPSNICNSCINKLEDIKDISLSIDIWKNNSRMKKEKEAIEEYKADLMPVCIICSSRSNMISFEANGKLSQLFRNITNIDVKNEMASATGNGICSECIDKLEDISSFIHLSLCNDGKLEYAVGRKKDVKCETFSDDIGIHSSTITGLKLEDSADNNEAKKENPFEKTIVDEIEEKQENIDIKEPILNADLSSFASKIYRAELATRSQKCTQNLFLKQDSPYPAEEELSQCDWSNKNSTYNSDSRRLMLTNTREKFKCDLCGKRFSHKKSLQSHLLIHPGEKSFECDFCEKSFNQKVKLKKHLRSHTEEKPFQCDICDKSFSREWNLRIHSRTHTGEKPFKCDICDKSFIQGFSLRTHMQTHTGEKPFECAFCDKSFSQSSILRYHMRTHTGEKPFKCDICDKSFSLSSLLRYHRLTHTGEKPLKCDYCGKSFNHKGDLERHLRTHTGEKPFKCDVCDKSFNQGGHLQNHMRSHTGEKPFICDYCEKCFIQKGDLKRHLRTHTGEKPFTCGICDKSFSRECNLRIHSRTHTGEKPFKCGICDKSFSRGGTLRTHMQTHT